MHLNVMLRAVAASQELRATPAYILRSSSLCSLPQNDGLVVITSGRLWLVVLLGFGRLRLFRRRLGPLWPHHLGALALPR